MVSATVDSLSSRRWQEDRLATLRQRKQSIEQLLVQKNEELRKLCVAEAELTGVMPPEVPLPNESFTPVVSHVYDMIDYSRTTSALKEPQQHELESIAALELDKQVQAGVSETALVIVQNGHENKAVRRKNRLVYQQSQQRLNELEQRLGTLMNARSRDSRPTDFSTNNRKSHSTLPALTSHSFRETSKSFPRYGVVNGAAPPPKDAALMQRHSHSQEQIHARYLKKKPRPVTADVTNDMKVHDIMFEERHQTPLGPHQLYETAHYANGNVTWRHSGDVNKHLNRKKRSGSLDRAKARTLSRTGNFVHAEHHEPYRSQCNTIGVHTYKNVKKVKLLRTHNKVRSTDPDLAKWAFGDPNETMTDRQNTLGKKKQKEWYETSLDTPPPVRELPPRDVSDDLSPRSLHDLPPREISSLDMPSRDIHQRDVNSREIHPRDVHPREIHEHDFHSLGIHPRDVHPREIHQRDVNSLEIHPRDVCPREYYQREVNQREMHQRDVHSREMPSHDVRSRDMSPRDIQTRDIHSRGDMSPRDIHALDLPPRDFHPYDLPARDMSPHDVSPRDIPARDMSPRDLPPRNYSSSRDAHDGSLPQTFDGYPCDVIFATSPSTSMLTHASKNSSTKIYKSPSVTSLSSYAKSHASNEPNLLLTLDQLSLLESNGARKVPCELDTTPVPSVSSFSPTNHVAVQSPKNCTIIEPGLWKPYREVSKPFEMSDFYKYSTKFRNRNNASHSTGNEGVGNGSDTASDVPDGRMMSIDHSTLV